jgi:hypothetical protein
VRRATAESLNANRARAGIKIEKVRRFDARGKNIEESFAKAVTSRPCGESCGSIEGAGTKLTGDDAHEEKNSGRADLIKNKDTLKVKQSTHPERIGERENRVRLVQ